VPAIIKAIGAVAQSEVGARLVPAKLPASNIRVISEPARALLILSTQTLLKPAAEKITIHRFLVDVCPPLLFRYWGWSLAYF
jgi:hypothetical protein